MIRKGIHTLIGAFCAWAILAAAGMPTNVHAGANIAWVSFHSGDDTPSAAAATAGFTEASDIGYTRLLRAAGHTVTRYVTTATPDAALLNTFDLVIISRAVPSGHYQTVDSTPLWHGLTKPTMILGGYIIRASRLGYTIGDTIPDTGGPIRLTVNDPAHPIFTGVELDAANLMVNVYAEPPSFNNLAQRGISVNTDPAVDGATVLATVGTDTETSTAIGGMIIGEFPAGTFMWDAAGDVTAAKRLIFLTGSRERDGLTSEGAGIFDLQTDGTRMFFNAVNYMTGLPLEEPPPLVSGLSPASGTAQHFAPVGFAFQASSGTAEGIAVSNISLVLNGTDVTSSLVITGTPQEWQVSYTNLAANTEYTGVITVRDGGGREVVVNFDFDTLTPFTLPAGWAFPASAAVTTAEGFRARIVQGYDAPVLANSADRAEAQLAGTLIDPFTLEPYPNQAIPSTDNPDGSYNQSLINWSVESGLALERGNFQDPAFPDQLIPGTVHNLNLAAEVLTYLELEPGRYVMGVNSDDGFVVSSGLNARDLFAEDLGRFDGARGSADTIFQFEVTEAGLYPFRLVYYQGDGGGNLEWFTVDPFTGEKTLINDRSNPDAIRAWREISTPERPYITSALPAPGEINVALETNITITIQEDGAEVQEASVELSINGEPVSADATKAGNVTTVRYTPASNLQSDTPYTVDLTYSDSASNERTASYQFTTVFVPPVLTNGANIVWVSFHPGDEEPSANAAADPALFTEAPDVAYTRLLQDAGHTVTRYVTVAAPEVELLNTYDLVIISRSVPSGNYDSPESTALWQGITKPTIHLGGYLLRANRLGFTTGDTMVDTTASSIRLKANSPSHPIFTGIPLDGENNMVNEYANRVTHNGTLQSGISVNSSPVVSGGVVLATVGTAGDPALGGMVIGEFPAGTTMGNGNTPPDVAAADRLIFLTGSRESGFTTEAAGIYDLTSNGARLFLNAVGYMTGLLEPAPTGVSITAARAANGDLVISWPEADSTGYVLQSNSALGTAGWQAVAGGPVAGGGQLSVTVPTADEARFFRLARP